MKIVLNLQAMEVTMLKGYDDFGKHVKITHWPLRSLLRCKNEPRDLSNPQKQHNWGKINTSCGAIRWPYTTCSMNGWDPFKNKQRKGYRCP